MNARDLRHTEWVLCHRQDLISAGELNKECSPELIVALAEYALRRGHAPAALFSWFLQHEDSWTTVSKKDLAVARERVLEHRRRQKSVAKRTNPENEAHAVRTRRTHRSGPARLAKPTYIDSDAHAVHRPGPDFRVPSMRNYSQAEIDALSSSLPNHRRDVLHRVLAAILLVAAVAYLLTFRM